VKRTSDINVLVVGDIMLDTYIVGQVDRISPEAPVPIVKVTDEYSTLGGCGNVFNNIKSIGAGASCITSFGDDDAGHVISEMLNDSIIIANKDTETIEKIRVVANHKETQMIRIDKEFNTIKMDREIVKQIAYSNRKCYDIIIVSDYAKGMINEDLMNYLKTLNTPIIVDPKPIHGRLYNDVFMITPNEIEFLEMSIMSSYQTGRGVDYILQTAGRDGMFLNNLKKKKITHIKTKSSDVYNVTGAGDTVIAVISVCIAMGIDVITSAKIANKCASYVVTKPGTTAVPKAVFEKALKQFSKKKKK